MELTIEHLAAYLPYGLKYNLPLDSERYESIMEHEPFRLALPFMSSEDEIKHFEKYKKMYLYQKNPQIMFDDNKLFLGQMESSLGFEEDDVYLSEVKPILRQLSYLAKEIEHNGEKFIPIDIIYKLWNEKSLGQFSKSIILQKVQLYTNSMPHFIVEKLHSWHFDTKGLIESELAINYNELNK